MILANGSLITQVSIGDTKDVNLAVEAARKAYKSSWGTKVPAFERGRLLSKLADIIEKNKDELAAIESIDCGESICSVEDIVATKR